jgi:hypothetical protein
MIAWSAARGAERMRNKRQHWIPQSYLKAWCDPATPIGQEPYVWQFEKEARVGRKRAPKKIFFENDLYTIPLADGVRDLVVEHGLAGLEERFNHIRERRLEAHGSLDSQENLIVRAFIVAMHSRTPFQLNHWRNNWARVAAMGRDMQAAIDAGENVPTSLPGGGLTLSQEAVEAFAAAPHGVSIMPTIEALLPIVCRMSLTLVETDDPVGFITSDAPCVWFDPEAHMYPPHMRAPGLAKPGIEITFPSSPRQLLLLTWRLPSVRMDAPGALLAEVNRRTRLHAREHFVVRGPETRSEWFGPGRPPEAP